MFAFVHVASLVAPSAGGSSWGLSPPRAGRLRRGGGCAFQGFCVVPVLLHHDLVHSRHSVRSSATLSLIPRGSLIASAQIIEDSGKICWRIPLCFSSSWDCRWLRSPSRNRRCWWRRPAGFPEQRAQAQGGPHIHKRVCTIFAPCTAQERGRTS